MKKHRILVLYGSETGTAQDAAEQIQEMAQEKGYGNCILQSLINHNFKIEVPNADNLIFCVSTTGDGEVPSDMKHFWKSLLHKSIANDWLKEVSFAVFGLGDSSYAKYNATARKLNARLLQLGAKELVPRGLGDDQHPLGYFGAFNPWLSSLFDRLTLLHPPPPKTHHDNQVLPQKIARPIYTICYDTRINTKVDSCSQSSTSDSSFYAVPEYTLYKEMGIITGSVICNVRLTADTWSQDVRHIEIKLDNEDIQYDPGAIAVIYPENTDENVSQFIAYLSKTTSSALHADTILSINLNNEDLRIASRFPSECTLNELCKRYLDISGTPRRGFFAKISRYANSNDEKEKLIELASPEGADLLYSYCIRERKTYVEVLSDFPKTSVPLNILLELIPAQRPRSYSIASSSLLYPGKIHLCAAIVAFTTPYKRQRYGVCSQYLSLLRPGQKVHFWIKSGIISKLRMDQNILLIGPGTGVAPLRAIVQEHYKLHSGTSPTTTTQCQIHLYFGCRHEALDFLYRDELLNYRATGIIKSFYTAFSRDQEEKIYVQTRLLENKESIFEHLVNGGICIISGSAKKMPMDVHNTMIDILQTEGSMTKLEAENVIKYMIREKQYIVETW